jgi:hypothetical protein
MLSRSILLSFACFSLAACGGDDTSVTDAAMDSSTMDGSTGDGATDGSLDGAADGAADAAGDGAADGGGDAGGPGFTCTMGDIVKGDQCLCLADGVCKQILFCLGAMEAEARGFGTLEECTMALRSDCMEDLTDPDLLPTEFTACIADIHDATCMDLGSFESVSGDFPASCENLRSVETALGISP